MGGALTATFAGRAGILGCAKAVGRIVAMGTIFWRLCAAAPPKSNRPTTLARRSDSLARLCEAAVDSSTKAAFCWVIISRPAMTPLTCSMASA